MTATRGNRAIRDARFVLAYFRLNLASAMEYRVSFVMQCLGMLLNDLIIFFFWWLFFERFPQVGGWEFGDLFLLWGVVATAYGIAATVFGNWARLATVIVQGQLDYYLGLPRDVLLHVLVSRMSVSGWGDLLFGLVSFGIAGWMGLLNFPLAVVLVASSTVISISFAVLLGSLAFFMGNAEAVASQGFSAAMHFTTYPGSIFRGWVKVLLLTAIPAGFIGHVPVELLREFDPWKMAAVLGFAVGIWWLARWVFRLGLRRYESGNLIVMQG